MDTVNYTYAGISEEASIKSLLKECGLPYEDIVPDNLDNYILAKINNDIIGIIGLELFNEFGLLRSFCVTMAYRKSGIGKKLYKNILAYAHLQGIKALYSLTMTAEKYFHNLGFSKIIRDEVPEAIKSTAEFQSVCPSTAICLSKNIDIDVQYFPRNILQLKPDVPGAKMWAIALTKTMFTYFEVEPNSIFEPHAHESEQITMVLDGILYFQINTDILPVEKGEVIAIPTNIPHSVFTKNDAVKAVDAWSPVMNKYK